MFVVIGIFGIVARAAETEAGIYDANAALSECQDPFSIPRDYPTHWTIHPQDVSLHVGASVTFTCDPEYVMIVPPERQRPNTVESATSFRETDEKVSLNSDATASGLRLDNERSTTDRTQSHATTGDLGNQNRAANYEGANFKQVPPASVATQPHAWLVTNLTFVCGRYVEPIGGAVSTRWSPPIAFLGTCVRREAALASLETQPVLRSDEERESQGSHSTDYIPTLLLGIPAFVLTLGLTYAGFKCMRRRERRREMSARISEESMHSHSQHPHPPPGSLRELYVPALCGMRLGVGIVGGFSALGALAGSKNYRSPAIRRPSHWGCAHARGRGVSRSSAEERQRESDLESQPPQITVEKSESKCEYDRHSGTNPFSPKSNKSNGGLGYEVPTGMGVSDGIGMGIGMGASVEYQEELQEKLQKRADERAFREEHGQRGSCSEKFDAFPSSLGAQRTLGTGGFSPL